MSNSLLTVDMITKESLEVLHEKLSFAGTVNRQYDDSFAKSGAKQGNSLRIRKPNKYTVRDGRVMDVQEQAEEKQDLTVATQKGVDMSFNSVDLALSIDMFSERYIEPAMSVLAAKVEQDIITQAIQSTYQAVGTAGTVVGASGDISALGLARAKLNQQAAPDSATRRSAQIDSVTMATIVNGTKGLFQPSKDVANAFREGYYGRNAQANFYENEKTWTLTNGDDVVGAIDELTETNFTQGTSTLHVDAFGTGTLPKGAVFTIAGLYDCHPETKQPYPHLKQFVVTSEVTIGSNEGDVTFSPAIYTTGAKQNVAVAGGGAVTWDSTTWDGAVVTFWGSASTSYRQNIMYDKNAFTFVTADLPLMDDAHKCVRRKKDDLSMRVWQASDIRNDELLLRLDILYGFAELYPEWACRISN